MSRYLFSRIFFFLTLIVFYSSTHLLFCPFTVSAAEVKNVRPSQVGSRIMFEFDVVGDEPNEDAEVSVTITVRGRQYTQETLHLEGDFGKTKTGRGRKIYWNVLQDFQRGLNEDFEWNISAGGGKLVKDPSTGIEMVLVKGGCYQMGDTFGDGDSDEKPVHEVCVDDFYIGKFEVTQGQWQAVMGNNPSNFKNCGDNCPVENVSWNDAQEFISRLNEKVPLSKGGTRGLYRLPTEAEWEYAARSGGKREKYAGGDDVDSVAWYNGNSGGGFFSSGKTQPVGTKAPNGLGIYDMSGNVWEWVQDWKGSYSSGSQNNPTGPSSGKARVIRGGGVSMHFDEWYTRTSHRHGYDPADPYGIGGSYLGFRLVRTR
ncbi:MAG: hypothetical protein EPN22_15435 [Nitrospirae bacterium]|nr:MAG: hypothetical protein EPN22_15435 [Nitrospirota bacterium]